jgi:hypothetical protein
VALFLQGLYALTGKRLLSNRWGRVISEDLRDIQRLLNCRFSVVINRANLRTIDITDLITGHSVTSARQVCRMS